MVAIPIYQSRSEEIRDALIQHVFSEYNMPEYTIMDLDSAFMYVFIIYFFKKLGIQIKTPSKQESFKAENGTKALATILTKHLKL